MFILVSMKNDEIELGWNASYEIVVDYRPIQKYFLNVVKFMAKDVCLQTNEWSSGNMRRFKVTLFIIMYFAIEFSLIVISMH